MICNTQLITLLCVLFPLSVAGSLLQFLQSPQMGGLNLQPHGALAFLGGQMMAGLEASIMLYGTKENKERIRAGLWAPMDVWANGGCWGAI